MDEQSEWTDGGGEREVGVGTLGETGSGACRGSVVDGGERVEEEAGLSAGEDRKEVVRM